MKNFRDIFGLLIFVLFATVVISNIHHALIVGAMISIVSAVVGYYYGSTKTGGETAAKNADAVTAALRTSTEPQAVVVTNDEASPVPVEAKA